MPLLPEVPGRIDAAVQSLRASGYSRLTLVAHSMGAAMAVYHLADNPQSGFDSVVIIGMGARRRRQTENIDALGKISMPVFDLYGSEDLDGVLGWSGARAAAGGKIEYRQLQRGRGQPLFSRARKMSS